MGDMQELRLELLTRRQPSVSGGYSAGELPAAVVTRATEARQASLWKLRDATTAPLVSPADAACLAPMAADALNALREAIDAALSGTPAADSAAGLQNAAANCMFALAAAHADALSARLCACLRALVGRGYDIDVLWVAALGAAGRHDEARAAAAALDTVEDEQGQLLSALAIAMYEPADALRGLERLLATASDPLVRAGVQDAMAAMTRGAH